MMPPKADVTNGNRNAMRSATIANQHIDFPQATNILLRKNKRKFPFFNRAACNWVPKREHKSRLERHGDGNVNIRENLLKRAISKANVEKAFVLNDIAINESR